MTSSTILDTSSLPHFGRLRNQLGGCAWIPAKTANRNSSWLQFYFGNVTNVSMVATKTADSNSSWLQVDLGSLTNVSAVATQGSCSGGQWTKSYVIMCSENGVDWKHYGELGTIRVGIQAAQLFMRKTIKERVYLIENLVHLYKL